MRVLSTNCRERLMAGVVLFLALLAQGVKAQTSPPSASIDGTVLDLRGQPIESATVSAVPESGPPRSATTSKEGRFAINNLPSGRYALVAEKAGFLNPTANFGDRQLTLGGGQHLKGTRFVLTPEAAISGRVSDRSGQPLAGIVVALRQRNEGGRIILVPPDASDDWTVGKGRNGTEAVVALDGSYRLFGLPPGEYYLGFWAGLGKGKTSNIVPATFFPGVTRIGEAAPLTVRPGSNMTGMDIKPPQTGRYTVNFQPVDPPLNFAEPIPRMFEIIQRDANGLAVTLGRTNNETGMFKRDQNGTWQTPPLHPGMYEIRYGAYLGAARSLGHVEVTLVDRDVNAGKMEVHSGHVIQGKVLGLPEATNQLYRLVLISLDGLSALWLPPSNTASVLRPGGTLPSVTVIPGRYRIGLAGLPPDMYIASTRYGGREVHNSGFDFDGSASPLEVKLARGVAVEGVVHDKKGEPGEDCLVAMIRSTTDREHPEVMKTTVTDQAGRFEIRGVGPGEYRVVAWEGMDSSDLHNPERLRRVVTQAVNVRISETEVRGVRVLSIARTN